MSFFSIALFVASCVRSFASLAAFCSSDAVDVLPTEPVPSPIPVPTIAGGVNGAAFAVTLPPPVPVAATAVPASPPPPLLAEPPPPEDPPPPEEPPEPPLDPVFG